MNFYNILIVSIALFVFVSCSKKEIKESVINEKSLEMQVLEAYKEGKESLEAGDVILAAKKFNEAEILYPQSDWASRSALMAAYSYYVQDYYSDAEAELERYLKVYPKSENLDYAYYLLAVTNFEQIVDEKKDLESILRAKKYFKIVINQYPNTNYALDAEFKMDLINDILASKEMYVGRYYFERKKWIAAINRFKKVVDDYDTTIYVEEALHRLVEIHYTIGLIEEAKKYASVLGYNYESSQWYENSYSIFNKKYKKEKSEKNEKKKSFLSKVKSLF